MEEFTTALVKNFEKKLKEYEEEAAVGGIPKTGKMTEKVARSLGTVSGAVGGLVSGTPGAVGGGSTLGGNTSSAVSNYFGGKSHRQKAKRINEVFGEKTELRNILVKTGGDIFRSFESQFSTVTDADGGRTRAMEKLAVDAMDRAINYIDDYRKNNPSVKIAVSYDLITKGVILGKSKKGFGASASHFIKVDKLSKTLPESIKVHLPKSGHTLKNKEQKWNTADLYSNTGVVRDENGIKKYYIMGQANDGVNIYGYRLFFKWESWELERRSYKEVTKPSEEYEYTLKPDEFDEKLKDILRNINRNDPLTKLTRGELEEIVEQKRQKTSTKERVWFDICEPVKHFTGRDGEDGPLEKLHESLQTESGVAVISQVASVIGLGGIGKTELARKYAWEKRKDYDDNVIWINAEKEESLKESFHSLAKQLKIPLKKIDNDLLVTKEGCIHQEKGIESMLMHFPGNKIYFESLKELKIPLEQTDAGLHVLQAGGIQEENDIKYIISGVYNYFKDMKSLFIFDNAEEFKDIKGFLPCSLPPDNKKPYILITSRNQDWNVGKEGSIEVVEICNLTLKEATEFVRKALGINEKDTSQENEIEELANLLQCFPLALEQATAYINENANLNAILNKTFKVSEYLEEYKNEKEKTNLLNFVPKYGNDRYVRTVFTTWRITLQNIKNNEDIGKLALNILNIMVYLDPDEIPTEKFFSQYAGSKKKLLKAIALLQQYSMINIKNGMANIHRLVQEIVRLELRRENIEENVLEEALALIHGVDKERESVSHFKSLWGHASNYTNLIDDFFLDTQTNYVIPITIITPLQIFIELGNCEAIDTILTRTKEKYSKHHVKLVINKMHGHQLITVLHMAAYSGNLEIVKCLVDNGSDINVFGRKGITPLHKAAESGNLDVVKYLVDKHAKIDGTASYNIYRSGTPLHAAAESGHLDIVKYLCDNGADLNAKCLAICLRLRPLDKAAMSGNLDVMKYLVGKYAENKIPLTEGDATLLHWAAKGGKLNVVKYVVDKHIIDVNKMVDSWETPLHWATSGTLEVVEYLVSKGANLSAETLSKETTLHKAALSGKLDIVEYLVGKGIDVNSKTTLNETPLHFAAISGKLEVVKYLVSRDAKFNDTNDKKETLLHLASKWGNIDIVLYIVGLGVDVNAVAENGTPLHYAAENGKLKVVEHLVSTNADVNAKDYNNNTPLLRAAKENYWNIVKCLVKKGADVNVMDEENRSPLHIGVEKRRTFLRDLRKIGLEKWSTLDIVTFLLNNKANPDIKNGKGKTPLDLVQESKSISERIGNKELELIKNLLLANSKRQKSKF